MVIRVYKESGELKIITSEKGDCSYSNVNCNFEIDDGIKMITSNYIIHNAEWKANRIYHIRCRDKYNNQPNPNTCSIILRSSESTVQEESKDNNDKNRQNKTTGTFINRRSN